MGQNDHFTRICDNICMQVTGTLSIGPKKFTTLKESITQKSKVRSG